ncbi:MAG: hypothetical protein HUJ54_14200 [Erysipelotrichaceae bacterium]|nr:hypothetical protein [Erysipelotrichaceae bacterium]
MKNITAKAAAAAMGAAMIMGSAMPAFAEETLYTEGPVWVIYDSEKQVDMYEIVPGKQYVVREALGAVDEGSCYKTEGKTFVYEILDTYEDERSFLLICWTWKTADVRNAATNETTTIRCDDYHFYEIE